MHSLIFAVQVILIVNVATVCFGNYAANSGNYRGYPESDHKAITEKNLPPEESKYRHQSRNRVVKVASQTKHTIKYVNVNLPTEKHEPQIIDIDGDALPILMRFRSTSSRIHMQHSHTGSSAAQIQETKSEDEPQYLRHSVTKPIIQEVHEIVMPYRKVIQEIHPVREEIQTIIAKKLDRKYDPNLIDEPDREMSGRVPMNGGSFKGNPDNVSGLRNVKQSIRYY